MKISVVIALAHRQQTISLDVDAPMSARQAVFAALEHGLDLDGSGVVAESVKLGVFGEHVQDDYALNDGDRVELYRPLQQDPMELRRQRAASEAGRLSKRRK